jgi:hypothetical protein
MSDQEKQLLANLDAIASQAAIKREEHAYLLSGLKYLQERLEKLAGLEAAEKPAEEAPKA